MERPFWVWKHVQHWPDGGSSYLIGQIGGDTVTPFRSHSYYARARQTRFPESRYGAHELDDVDEFWVFGCEYAARQFELFPLPTMGMIIPSGEHEIFCAPSIDRSRLRVSSHGFPTCRVDDETERLSSESFELMVEDRPALVIYWRRGKKHCNRYRFDNQSNGRSAAGTVLRNCRVLQDVVVCYDGNAFVNHKTQFFRKVEKPKSRGCHWEVGWR
jgi:hypothetical protein